MRAPKPGILPVGEEKVRPGAFSPWFSPVGYRVGFTHPTKAKGVKSCDLTPCFYLVAGPGFEPGTFGL
jgi:hypothetical protein